MVGELPDDLANPLSPAQPGKPDSSALGLKVERLSEEDISKLGVPQGVLVAAVSEGPAARAGIRRGDVLVTLDNKPVTDPGTLAKLVAGLQSKAVVPVLIHRDGSPRFLALRMTE
jgi:serine protease Do